jgi:multidrug efflux pump subunit AcrA (membrane-fusion protein)
MATDIAIDLPATDAAGGGVRAWRKRLPLIIGGILVVVATAIGVRKYIWSLHHESTDNAQLDGHITVIAPRVQAFVSRVLVDDNQHVKAGDTLVVLDDRDLKVRLQQAEADLSNAEAAAGSEKRGGQARSQLLSSRAQQASAQAAIASAEASYKKAAPRTRSSRPSSSMPPRLPTTRPSQASSRRGNRPPRPPTRSPPTARRFRARAPGSRRPSPRWTTRGSS